MSDARRVCPSLPRQIITLSFSPVLSILAASPSPHPAPRILAVRFPVSHAMSPMEPSALEKLLLAQAVHQQGSAHWISPSYLLSL